jgi:hypothetical protein
MEFGAESGACGGTGSSGGAAGASFSCFKHLSTISVGRKQTEHKRIFEEKRTGNRTVLLDIGATVLKAREAERRT